MPALFAGVSIGASEKELHALSGEVQSRLRQARINKSCVILRLYGGILVLAPQALEAHFLSFSRLQRIGYLGSNERSEEQDFEAIVERAAREDESRNQGRDAMQLESRSMSLSQNYLNDLNMEFGDLLHCFKGTYLIHVAGLWCIVPNPRWKRIWRIVKRLSKSIKPTSIKAFMISITWEFVDSNTNKLNKVFWQPEYLRKNGTLLDGSAKVVRALSRFLSKEVIERLGGERIATVAQNFLASCPSIVLRVQGPKRSWKGMYSNPRGCNREDENREVPAIKHTKLCWLDYYADSYHMFRPADLYFGTSGESRFVRLKNQEEERWVPIVEDIDDGMSRTIQVGNRVIDIAPKEDPPDDDITWNNPWRVG